MREPEAWEDDMEEAGDEDEAEDAVALRALGAAMEIEGDDELAQAQREALVAVAEEAVALQGRRQARERREAAARRAAERERKWAERAQDEERAALFEARLDADARAREARLAAVERAQRERRAPARHEEDARRHTDRRRREEGPVDGDACGDASDGQGDLRAMADGFHDAVFDAARAAPADVDDEDDAPEAIPQPDDAEVTADEAAGSTPGDDLPPLTGTDLADWRARHGLTQQAAADRLGVRQGTVSKAEGRAGAVLGPALREALSGVLAEELHSA